MKVLHVNSARAFGGGERHLVDLARELATRGHEVHVALRPGAALERAFADDRNVRIVTLPLRNAVDVESALRLAMYARRHGIEIIHAHVARDYPVAALAAQLGRRTAFVITRHLLFPLKSLHRVTLGDATKVICVSRGVADAMRASRIIADDKIVVIPNGVDLRMFEDRDRREPSPNRSARDDTRFVVGTAGELSAHKGHEDFIRAARLICLEREDVSFVIVGEDSAPGKPFRLVLERMIGELKLNGRVRLPGWTDDVAAFYRSLDLFVSAARVEPFGLVMIEAMASGAPTVIATATDGAREIIDDGLNGSLVPIGDVERIARAISDLLDDAATRSVIRDRALERVRERFSLHRMTDAVEAVYNETLDAA